MLSFFKKSKGMKAFQDSPLFHFLPNGDIICLCCQHKCVIPPGKLGKCRVRANIDGKPHSPTWGQYTVCIDPVEKKPLYHFLPGSKVYSYGTVGCNFNCQFCQNSSLSMWKLDIEDVAALDNSEGRKLAKHTPEEMVRDALRSGCLSIASTYNEPTVSTEYSYEVFKLAKAKGLKTIYVTNGFESVETLNFIGPYLDAVNIDLKSFREEFYVKVLGGHLKGVCNTIKRCSKMGIHTEVTTLLIPDANDSDEEITDIANFIAGVDKDIPWHVSAYHDDYKFSGRGRTPVSTLERAVEIGKKAGLKYIYMGNVRTPEGRNTFCPKCGNTLINREWFDARPSLKKGTCKCGQVIPGVFVDAVNVKPRVDHVPQELLDEPTTASVALAAGGNTDESTKDGLNFVAYASQGGTSKEFAEKIGQNLGYKVIDFASLDVATLQAAKNAVFAVSTYGRGHPPATSREAWGKISEMTEKLPNLKFAILGCGSSSFEATFVGFAKSVNEKLLSLGGTQVTPLCTRDENEDEDDEKVDQWITQLKFT
ncbi:flavodoxin family protein [Tritrichomonas foetus]|uniref:tRNA 4-demethylwyosine synthase (AdoMet-dependent) n=1 Tax=Tritrichomonas foetus TaxID=1144522 RepID=A0A1J4JSX8_9EUKA|nr:flavodoxin family protein [Tritrichomonas foetus]|eukprot:OHT01850.1 flavodoxin family protein [Tritrichomonas foetus]